MIRPDLLPEFSAAPDPEASPAPAAEHLALPFRPATLAGGAELDEIEEPTR